MLKNYLNQTAELKRAEAISDRGDVIYGNAVTVPCRRQSGVKNILTANEQVIKSSTVYYLDQPAAVDDELNGKRVLAVEEWTAPEGVTVGWKVWA
ncbi:hypothetical protein FACS1894202_09820 [Clostridia bacterium]|nr:hypothetical protein FACS1894202_09820 [Clostridia bacterium]